MLEGDTLSAASSCSGVRTSTCNSAASRSAEGAAAVISDRLARALYPDESPVGKSITLDGTGTFASILASLTTGIIINAQPTDVITIRGLSINGFCNGIRGINIIQAKTVNIEDCVIFRFAGDGITSTDANGLNLNIRETVIRDNGGDGINVLASTASVANLARVTLDHVRFSGNVNGVHARSGAVVSAHNSVFSGNSSAGLFADNVVGASFAVIRVRESQITGNGTGVQAGSGGGVADSVVEISQNLINFNTGNGVLVSVGGLVQTFSNNDIQGNGTNNCPGCTPSGPGQ